MFSFGQKYFLDANVFVYAVGSESILKEKSLSLFVDLAKNGGIAVTSIFVLEEVHHVLYRQTKNHKLCEKILQQISGGLGDILPVTKQTFEIACSLTRNSKSRQVSIKDYYHVATMLVYRIEKIISFDTDFDHFDGIVRISA